jgi:hypothetical protein
VGFAFSGGLLLSVQDSASAEEVEPVTQPDPGPGSDSTSNILSSGECGRVFIITVCYLNSIISLYFLQYYRSVNALFSAYIKYIWCMISWSWTSQASGSNLSLFHFVHMLRSIGLKSRTLICFLLYFKLTEIFISKICQLNFPLLYRINMTTVWRGNYIWSWALFTFVMLVSKTV